MIAMLLLAWIDPWWCADCGARCRGDRGADRHYRRTGHHKMLSHMPRSPEVRERGR